MSAIPTWFTKCGWKTLKLMLKVCTAPHSDLLIFKNVFYAIDCIVLHCIAFQNSFWLVFLYILFILLLFILFSFQIQQRWRGYYVRKYIHNYHARQKYLDGLARKNEQVRYEPRHYPNLLLWPAVLQKHDWENTSRHFSWLEVLKSGSGLIRSHLEGLLAWYPKFT